MAVGEHEAVPVGPRRVRGVVLHRPGCRARGPAVPAPSPCPGGRSWRAAGRPWRTRGRGRSPWSSTSGGSSAGIGGDPTQRPPVASVSSRHECADGRPRAIAWGLALVTGGSRGIGAATAVALAVAGWDLVVSYREPRRRRRGGRPAMRRGREGRRPPSPPTCRRRTASRRCSAPSTTSTGGSTCSSTTPGSCRRAGPVVSYDAERLDAVLRLNVVGAFLAAAEAVRRMSMSSGGDGGVDRQRLVARAPCSAAPAIRRLRGEQGGRRRAHRGARRRGRQGGHPCRRRPSGPDRDGDPRARAARAPRVDAAARPAGSRRGGRRGDRLARLARGLVRHRHVAGRRRRPLTPRLRPAAAG